MHSPILSGIHHVTAIASDPQRNLDFYTQTLGLRLVKLTVNYDDPGTYHFYFGDAQGRPGTLLTFFPWRHAHRGHQGTGQVIAIALAVPEHAVGYWRDRLQRQGIGFVEEERMGATVLAFADSDGMTLELIAHAGTMPGSAWGHSEIPAEHAVRGVHSVTLSEEGYERTARLLHETMGFRLTAEQGNRFRYEIGEGGAGATVDLLCQPDAPPGTMGAGTVHHVAFRTPDDTHQNAWREQLRAEGYNVSPVMDRQYFHSIYYREPGGVLCEIATDPPGFTVDEPLEALGTALRLPAWLEPRRRVIEQIVAPLRLPHSTAGGTGQ
ncbi:MAG: ring-cleaving dioxygenase [Chloroherpetonaceae bacterium]|nr:ring-cleaving dioxygenase [Chloroherpetonaceae bacterium]